MSERRDDRETLASEAALASDETLRADSGEAPSGNVVVRGRASTPRTQLGRYRILRVLGRGGMGQVYEAEDPELGRRVAIKVLRDGSGDPASLRREAQALAKLVHPHVIGVFDVGTADGDVYVVMQLVEGESIDRWLAARQAGSRQIVAAFVQAGQGLAAAHAAGLVHCDVKPANILVGTDGVVRVGDFGLARTAGDGEQIAGTPAYMAPEQLGGTATAASDQYAFCVALWEQLAGERPFEDPTLSDDTATATRRVRRPMPRGKRIPPRVQRALERGLAGDPGERHASMEALLAELVPSRWRGIAWASFAAAVLATGALGVHAAVRREPPTSTPHALTAPPPPPRLDGTRARALTSVGDEACAYSPAVIGREVVFDRTEGEHMDLYAVPLAGGAPRQLTSAPTWEWRAHPGRRAGEVLHLVHDPATAGAGAVAALDLATGSDAHVIEVSPHDAVAIGATIAYIPENQGELRLWRDGKERVLVTAAPLHFELLSASPDGAWLAITTSAATIDQLCLVEVATAHMTCDPRPIRAARPAFGADGRSVYYAAFDGIHRRELRGGNDELLLPGTAAPGGLAVTPDGSALVYSACGNHTRVIDIANGASVIDDAAAHDPAVGVDGELAWTHDHGGHRVLVVHTATGERELTPPELGSVREPAFSPDGTRVAFSVEGSHPGLYTTMVSGTEALMQATDNASDHGVVWLDDSHLAFTRMDERSIGSVDTVAADGGPVHQVATSRALYGIRGHQLLVGSLDRFLWLDPATGRARPGPAAPDDIYDAVLSRNGKWLAYHGGNGGQDAYRMSLDPPGQLEHVGSLPAAQTANSRLVVTDDGHVWITPDSWSGDLVIVPAATGTRL